jgi:hypothetical protein
MSYATGKPASQIRHILSRLKVQGHVHDLPTSNSSAKLWMPGPTPEIRTTQIIGNLKASFEYLTSRIGRVMETREYVPLANHCLALLEELSDLQRPV